MSKYPKDEPESTAGGGEAGVAVTAETEPVQENGTEEASGTVSFVGLRSGEVTTCGRLRLPACRFVGGVAANVGEA